LLVKPAGTGPHPAVVILHGSGRADGLHDAPDYRIHANAFVRQGLAVLVYDKRGLGDSQGDFSTAVYDDFAHDALSAVRFLRSREDIDPRRIGLLGTSEGGWLTPEVAARAGDIAFVINKCGAPLPWDQTVLFEIENELQATGLDPDAVGEVLQLRSRIWKYYVDVAAAGAESTRPERDAINADLAAIAGRIDSPESSGLPTALEELDTGQYARLAANVSYDSTPYLLELGVPMLWIFGENDVNVPTSRSIAVLDELNRKSGRNITTKVYPGVGHSLMSWKGIASAGYVPGYLDLIGNWARDNARRAQQAR
jgi:pimeloyl-ACP methyl ester carboxylesterase